MTGKIRDRRSVFLSGLALGAAARIGLTGAPAAAASPGSEPLKVRLVLDGKTYEFDETKGRDLGDYKGPGFVQRCVMVTVADLPMSVFMRPDQGSERVEVVFELGRMWSGPPRHLGAYTVEIARGEKQLARVEVPYHYWFSRWRWQSAPRPRITTPQALMAASLVPPYENESVERPSRPAEAHVPVAPAPAPRAASAVPRAAPAAPTPPAAPPAAAASGGGSVGLPQASAIMGDLRRGPNGELIVVPPAPASAPPRPAAASAPPRAAPAGAPQRPVTAVPSAPERAAPGASHSYSIMGLAGLDPYMPTTGDREDIGPMTEAQARWICTEASDAYDIMIAQAEASGTFPWNIRDEKTGAPVNFQQHPKVGWFVDAPQMSDPFVPQLKTGMVVDWAHHPALTYVPFLATGDPYYLEGLQLSMTWEIGDVVPRYRLDDTGILSHGQTRSYAWCLRDLAQLAKSTPESVPNWLLPRAYWERILENNRAWFTESYLKNPDPPFRVFRAATVVEGSTQVPDPRLNHIPASSTWMEEYLAIILGWVVLMGHATWHDIFAWKIGSSIARTNGKSGWERAYATPYGTYFKRSVEGPWIETWKDLWDANVELQRWHVTDPDRWMEGATGYLTYTRAALGIAAHMGIAEAKDCFAWADQVVAGTPGDRFYRWRIGV